MRIALCDDSREFLDQMMGLMERWSEQSGIQTEIYCFDHGDALLAKSTEFHMDVIFLDIIMPLLNGMDTAKDLRQRDSAVKIVFLTSSPDFALDSYFVKAQDYLLKPVTYERIREVLDECSTTLHIEPKSIVLKTNLGFQKIYLHNIEFAEAQNKRVILYLCSGKNVEVVTPLYSFKDRFTDSDGFFKCHRSYIVYLPNIDHFNMTEITTRSGRKIPIARSYAKAFQEAYFSHMFED